MNKINLVDDKIRYFLQKIPVKGEYVTGNETLTDPLRYQIKKREEKQWFHMKILFKDTLSFLFCVLSHVDVKGLVLMITRLKYKMVLSLLLKSTKGSLTNKAHTSY